MVSSALMLLLLPVAAEGPLSLSIGLRPRYEAAPAGNLQGTPGEPHFRVSQRARLGLVLEPVGLPITSLVLGVEHVGEWNPILKGRDDYFAVQHAYAVVEVGEFLLAIGRQPLHFDRGRILGVDAFEQRSNHTDALWFNYFSEAKRVGVSSLVGRSPRPLGGSLDPQPRGQRPIGGSLHAAVRPYFSDHRLQLSAPILWQQDSPAAAEAEGNGVAPLAPNERTAWTLGLFAQIEHRPWSTTLEGYWQSTFGFNNRTYIPDPFADPRWVWGMFFSASSQAQLRWFFGPKFGIDYSSGASHHNQNKGSFQHLSGVRQPFFGRMNRFSDLDAATSRGGLVDIFVGNSATTDSITGSLDLHYFRFARTAGPVRSLPGAFTFSGPTIDRRGSIGLELDGRLRIKANEVASLEASVSLFWDMADFRRRLVELPQTGQPNRLPLINPQAFLSDRRRTFRVTAYIMLDINIDAALGAAELDDTPMYAAKE